jgi:hypothetical protein
MKQSPSLATVLIGSTLALGGCELAGDIFQAGIWVGVILVLGIIGFIVWMMFKAGS